MCVVLPGVEHHSLLLWRLWVEAEKVRRGGEAGEEVVRIILFSSVKVVIIITIIIIMVIILR